MAAAQLRLGPARRIQRLIRSEQPAVMLCADVGLQVGPLPRYPDIDALGDLIALPFDAIFLTVAGLRWHANVFLHRPELGLVVRTDWCSQWRPAHHFPHADGRAVTITTPAEAADSGADAIAQYLLLGSGDPDVERGYIKRTAKCVRAAHAIGLPVIVEPLIRGGAVSGQERRADLMRLAIRTACELGADALKIEFPEEEDAADVIAASSVPTLMASTPPLGDCQAIARAQLGRAARADGVAYSADFFGSERPEELLAALRLALTE